MQCECNVCHGQGPDLSWIDQIVGEDGLEVSDEVVRAIIEKWLPKCCIALTADAAV